MDDIWMRVFDNLVDRVSGPMKFRVFVQPLVAMALAVSAGLQDARSGKPPYFWALFSEAQHRTEMLRDGWKSVGKVFVLALILDVVYQIVVQRLVYPGEAIVVAFLLAIFPYLILRGLVTRLTRNR